MNSLTVKGITEDATPSQTYSTESTRENEQAITILQDTYIDTLPYLFENREDYYNLVVPLYEACITGDWGTAKLIFNKRPDLVRCGLSKNLGTALHVAVTAKESKQTLQFVKNLVSMMTKDEVAILNKHSNTAFWIACADGNIKTAKIMLEKNRDLLEIRGNVTILPLSIAAEEGTRDIVKWLYKNSGKMTGDYWTDDDRDLILEHCVNRCFFDVALHILDDHPEVLARNVSWLLDVLAEKKANIREKNLITRIIVTIGRLFGMEIENEADEETDTLKLLAIIWKHATTTMSIDEIQDMVRSTEMLFNAAKIGNTIFIVELLRMYPDLMLDTNDDGLTIFHIAVMNRHEVTYSLLYEIGSSIHDICMKNDHENNNMLHLVGKSSKEMATKASGASLLMQRELLWFTEVRKIMPPYMREERNTLGETPYELFSRANEDLVSNGLKWMRDCMVVATLIVTVAFAAAFTVPGGYKEDNGLPFFMHKRSSLVFVIADALSLLSSSTSLLVFVSILTSRHNQNDFMYSLPSKLMTGLLTLLISVAAMMVTFSASFFVLYNKGLKWVPILIAAFTAVPVIVFAILQFPLLVDMFRSMYDSHYLFKPRKRMLYATKTRYISPCFWFPSKNIITRIFYKRC